MKRKLCMLATVAALALTAACGGSTEPEITVNGTWKGTTSPNAIRTTLLLTQNSTGSVTGMGSMDGPSGSLSLSIDGTYVAPSVQLTLSIVGGGYEPVTFSSSNVTRTTMQGRLNGSGFANETVTLTKQ